ncbi:diacylglycerol/lipid kinase family protein [Streptomyces sp. NPDC050504]|uniref:diacylglycerol/lipid kinase family protein n=1 Tax=Streptomyces sp. NPDC050504 TaxID=3365618 RepID=UPI00378E7B04
MASAVAKARLLARCALAAAALAVLVLFVALGVAGLLVIVSGLLGLAVCAVGVWWLLARRGALRVLGAVLAVGAPVAVLTLFIRDGLWATALLALALWAGSLACARAALRAERRAERKEKRKEEAEEPKRSPAPRRPVIIMNPKSGGGKVERFRLVERAEGLGARVLLLDPEAETDVEALARDAVADGADLLGVAGGDGTQALVAAVAAEHDLPFLVVSAGTRNHFAMDLGLDRTDPSRCLDALTDGVELRVDLGAVADRPFVNTVSFGVYADVVQRPEYRDAKAGTALGVMPDLLSGEDGRSVHAVADGETLPAQQAVLVSNNPYAGTDDPFDAGRRLRLDGGELGVIGVRVESAVQAAEMAVLGAQATGLNVLTARRVEVTADSDTIPVAVDGEALTFPTPVVCEIRPGALRVLVPRDRPGVDAPRTPLDWRRITVLALTRDDAGGRRG